MKQVMADPNMNMNTYWQGTLCVISASYQALGEREEAQHYTLKEQEVGLKF